MEQPFNDNTLTSAALSKADKEHYIPFFNRFELAFSKGEGCILTNTEGQEYLDALSGIAVTNLGHCHPEITRAIQSQAARLLHVSNFFVTPQQVALSEQLTRLAAMPHVFFTNSGTESFEGAVKLARKVAHKKGRGPNVVSMEGSFHGRTMAAMAAAKPSVQQGFGPMPRGFMQIPFNTIEAVYNLNPQETAAIVLEPVQGEGGIHPVDPAFLSLLKEWCMKHEVLLIFDEIQCGMGRTGTLFAKDQLQVEPDIMILAKALGNGMPIGAILCRESVAQAVDYGDHGTTFGGNPLACAAGLAVIKELTKPSFLEEVKNKGEMLRLALQEMAFRYSAIREVRGRGLMIGVELDFEAKILVNELLQRRVVANATAQNVLRLLPPLLISESQIQHLVQQIERSLQSVLQ